MEIEEELQLIELAKTNVQAFDRLYVMYVDKIYSYCMNRVGSKEIAEEITSITFLKTIETLHKFDTSKGLRLGCWLYKIAHNNIVDYFRSNAKRVSFSLKHYELPAEGRDIDEEITQEFVRKRIVVVLSKIKPRYQNILTLKFYTELSNEEIAENLEINSSQVAVLLHRALKSFEKAWASASAKIEANLKKK